MLNTIYKHSEIRNFIHDIFVYLESKQEVSDNLKKRIYETLVHFIPHEHINISLEYYSINLVRIKLYSNPTINGDIIVEPNNTAYNITATLDIFTNGSIVEYKVFIPTNINITNNTLHETAYYQSLEFVDNYNTTNNNRSIIYKDLSIYSENHTNIYLRNVIDFMTKQTIEPLQEELV